MHFNLKSTYFSVREEGGYVIINGRGFGHGVGMCQEGAMKMAAYNFNYEQITQFYFPGAYFYDTKTENFFEQYVHDLPEILQEEEYFED